MWAYCRASPPFKERRSVWLHHSGPLSEAIVRLSSHGRQINLKTESNWSNWVIFNTLDPKLQQVTYNWWWSTRRGVVMSVRGSRGGHAALCTLRRDALIPSLWSLSPSSTSFVCSGTRFWSASRLGTAYGRSLCACGDWGTGWSEILSPTPESGSGCNWSVNVYLPILKWY